MADTTTPKPKATPDKASTGKTSTWVTPRDPKGSASDKPAADTPPAAVDNP